MQKKILHRAPITRENGSLYGILKTASMRNLKDQCGSLLQQARYHSGLSEMWYTGKFSYAKYVMKGSRYISVKTEVNRHIRSKQVVHIDKTPYNKACFGFYVKHFVTKIRRSREGMTVGYIHHLLRYTKYTATLNIRLRWGFSELWAVRINDVGNLCS